MRARRVTFATRLYPPEVAAAAFREQRLAESFAEAGWDVTVLTTRAPEDATAAGSSHTGSVTGSQSGSSVRVRRWPVLRDASGSIRGYVPYLSFDLPLAFRALRRRPDLFIAEPPPTTGMIVRAVAALTRRPYVWYAADIWSDAAGTAGAPAAIVRGLRAMEVAVLRSAAVVLAISEPIKDRLVALGIPSERILTVGNGIDTTIFRPDGERHGAGEFFAYTGTVSEWQGAGIFIEALAAHRAAGGTHRLVVLGQGSELPKLKELAAQVAPGAVDFLGVVPPEESAAYLRAATAGLVSIKPGIGYDFALPTKIYAATGCGTPVIAAGDGAATELVARENLGWAAAYTVAAVREAMDQAAAQRGDSESVRSATAECLRAWTAANASLAAKADAARADVVARLFPPRD